jgi:hypothetical protein
MSTPLRLAAEVDYFTDHEKRLVDVREEVIEAAREEGANTAVRELIDSARRVQTICGEGGDARLFIATFCGAIQSAFPDLAKELAESAGMSHLYVEGN